MEEKLKIFYELYDRRRSVREFEDRPVEPDKLSRLLTILNTAQSAANRQPWHFIVIEKKDRAGLNDVLTRDGFKGAPVIIAACADPVEAWVRKADKVNYAWVDVAIAVTEMIGAATAEGLGTCWIASFDPSRVKRILNIPDRIDVVGLVAIGYPKDGLAKVKKDRKQLAEVIHYGKW